MSNNAPNPAPTDYTATVPLYIHKSEVSQRFKHGMLTGAGIVGGLWLLTALAGKRK